MKKFAVLLILMLLCGTAFAQDYSTVCANHILVPTEAEAIRLKNNIAIFDDFEQFAKKYSTCPSGKEGGSLGCFNRGQMVRPFEEAAFNGKVGEVTGPVKTRFGYHLIWVTKKY